jgi:twitching motility protein PilT
MTINELLQAALKNNASDVHLVAGLPPVFRIDGDLQKTKSKPLTAKNVEDLAFQMVNEEQEERFLAEKELDAAYSLPGGERFRINLHMEKGTIGVACRAIPKTIPSMDDLGIPEVAKNFARLPNGLVLITGPTGSGKSTTLASIIEDINKTRAENIITLEDPVEFIFEADKSIIRQRQLGTDMLTFAEGLKHALRQDPDVIMVGEMRDLETISTTLTLAETGHLVFATLHTYSAAQTVDRIIDVFPPHQQPQIRMQLAMTLRGIMSQQLVQKKDGGRAAIREVLLNNPAVANLIREGKAQQIKTVLQTSAKFGMFTMEQDVARLVKEKIINESAAAAYILK